MIDDMINEVYEVIEKSQLSDVVSVLKIMQNDLLCIGKVNTLLGINSPQFVQKEVNIDRRKLYDDIKELIMFNSVDDVTLVGILSYLIYTIHSK